MRKILPISVAALIVGALAFSGCQDTFTVNNKFDSVPGPDYVKVTYYAGANYVEWPEVPTASNYTVHRQLVQADGDEQDWPWVALNETPVTNKDGLKAVVDTTSASNVITAGRQYRYKVVTTAAGHNLGTGETESEVNDGEVALAAPTSLPAVTNLAASVIANGQLRVSWTANTNPAVKYDVFGVISGSNVSNSYLDGYISSSGIITVTAKFAGATTVFSPAATIPYSTANANFAVTLVSSGGNNYSVRLAWNLVPGATGYKVLRATYTNNQVASAYTQVATATNSDAVTNVIIKSDTPTPRYGYSYKLYATINGQDVDVDVSGVNNTVTTGIYSSALTTPVSWNSYWNGTQNVPIVYYNVGNLFSGGGPDLRSNESIKIYRRVNDGTTVGSWTLVGTITSAMYYNTGTAADGQPNNSLRVTNAAGVVYNYKGILVVDGVERVPPNSDL